MDVVIHDTVDWTFKNADTRYFSHAYHDYPARMIPQIADRLIQTYTPKASLLFDPYCGSGSVLVEGLLHGIEAVGSDLNPLARLIARTKTSYMDIKRLDQKITEFMEFTMTWNSENVEPPDWLDAKRVKFWFKPQAIKELSAILKFIGGISSNSVKLFFLTAFSETVRESSNTRASEFKLYRKPENKLSSYNPRPFNTMLTKIGRNRQAYGDMLGFLGAKSNWQPAHIYDFNTVISIPFDLVKPESVDVIITSPPYGDSHTTVAYGQYSRLSSDWIGFENPGKVDSLLMGGKQIKKLPQFECTALDEAIEEISLKDSKRALEVASFYADLKSSIANVAETVKSGGFACYVIANRKVKGITLPTDEAVISFFERMGFFHVETHHRAIPNKRMPLRNSPSNERGETDNTMIREIIVVVQKS